MLRLWLNHVRPSLHIALLDKPSAQQRWLGRSAAPSALAQPIDRADPDSLTIALDNLLSAKKKATKKSRISPCYVSLLLPDDVARYEVLPWSASLMQADEIRQFAIERFDMANQPVRDGWVVQAQWTTIGVSTLAYALPHTLLDALHQCVSKHGLILNRVIPVSALAHYGQLQLRKQNTLRILRNGANTSALLYLNGKLTAHLMEVARGSTTDSLQRLMSRLQISALTPDIRLSSLSLFGVNTDTLKEMISIHKPQQVRVLNPSRWGEWR